MAVYKTKTQEDPWVRVFDVTEPSSHEKGHTIYKVISKVFPKNSFESVSQVIVWKRYNDFKVLHKALLTIHRNLHLKGKFPPFAKSRFFGRFEGEIIEERRKSALALLEFAAQHPPLFTSQVFVKFFEGGESVRIQSELNKALDPPLLPAKVKPSTPSETSCPDASSEPSEIDSLLGGIWQHRKAVDEISLSSHHTEDELGEGEDDDDDDRTTFTDESSTLSTPLPSSELAFFDPLTETHTTEQLTEVSNTWLLSAIEACSRLDHSVSEDHSSPDPNSFSFPRPFDDGEEVESLSVTGTEFVPVKSQKEDDNFSSSDFSTSCAVSSSWKEFDPLTANATISEFEAASQFKVSSPVEPPTLTPLSPIVSNLDLADRNNSKYLTNAAEEISCAQQSEAVGDFTHAFAFYKTAIATLLEGVQADKNTERRDAVRRKINQYLVRAEEIYNKYLAEKVQDHKRWAVDSRFSPATVLNTTINSLRAPFHELSRYKVLGAIKKVLLVLDTTDNSTYVVKTLYKSPTPDASQFHNIVPQEVPYMVELYKVYETDYALFLVLQYATGGSLWDYICSYLQRSPLSPCFDCVDRDEDLKHTSASSSLVENVYSGRKLSNVLEVECSTPAVETQCELSSIHTSDDTDLLASAECPPSYVALFTKYAASSTQLVSLAKCNLIVSDVGDETDDDVPPEDTAVIYENPSVQEHLVQDSPSRNALPNSSELDNPATSNNNMLEQLIHKSKTLLQSVDTTIQASARGPGVDPQPSTRNNQQHQDENNVCYDLIESVKETEEDLVSPKRRTSGSNDISSFADKKQAEADKIGRTDLHIKFSQKPHHSPASDHHLRRGRPRRSSSTGSLELTLSQRVRHFSDVFQELDAAVTQAALDPAHLPESCIRQWIAELVFVVAELHKLGMVCQDLHPDNILLGERGHILLTYQCQWSQVDKSVNKYACDKLYAAPEVGSIFEVTSVCDWWSVGALLFEMLTGRALYSCHSGGITSHTTINIPGHVSIEAQDLLRKLLKYNPSERLGAGPHGLDDIKSHPFFAKINWSSMET
ncbi:ribosomal protein S6 kinase delta-1 [Tachypleus tridentatus]|uniref:ribosomal protein S6 kinase delta-1 n=1 Tax=Tachypleus tridentatus TaxID=6853 RepID=UPI003FD3B709